MKPFHYQRADRLEHAGQLCAADDTMAIAGGTNLLQLVKIMQGAEFVVSNDSGPMHIAAAVGTTVFALFGPTDPARTGPYGRGHHIIRAHVECAPCFRKKCDELKCLEGLGVREVYDTIRLSFSSFPPVRS